MQKVFFKKNDKVLRKYKDTLLYGTVVEITSNKVEFITPEGYVFVSDIGHLEKVNMDTG